MWRVRMAAVVMVMAASMGAWGEDIGLKMEILGTPVPNEGGGNVVAGEGFALRVSAVAASGQTAAGYRGTIHFASGDARATLPGDYTFGEKDAGVHTFEGVTLRTVEGFSPTREITARDLTTPGVTGETRAYVWWNVECSREGLVGRKTASGHVVATNDRFVALPALGNAVLHKGVRVVSGTGKANTTVLDKGPWFPNSREVMERLGRATDDSYWHTTGRPRVEREEWRRGKLNSGIELADGTFWKDLGSPARVWWRFR